MYVSYCTLVPSLQDAIIISTERSDIPDVKNLSRTQDRCEVPASCAGSVTVFGMLEDAEDCLTVCISVDI